MNNTQVFESISETSDVLKGERYLDLFDAESRIQMILKKANMSERRQILTLSGSDLANLSGLSCRDAELLKTHIASQLFPQGPLTALQILKDESLQPWKLSTSCPVIDKVLKGGFLSGVISEISGESACGKTQLCLQLCLSVQMDEKNGGGAVYICTEDVFPSRRMQQLIRFYHGKKRSHKFGDNIFIEHVADFESLDLCVEKRLPALLARGMVKLVVIDSVAALFRCHYTAAQMMERARHLSQFASVLHQLAAQHRIFVICVNQVSANMDGPGINSVTPALGLTWANQITCRVMMSRVESSEAVEDQPPNHTPAKNFPTYRQLSVLFAPHLAPARIKVYIDDTGMHGIEAIA